MSNVMDDLELIALATDIATTAHAGQVDAQGRDYVEFHLRPIAESLAVFGSAAVAAGWLHDVIEDTRQTPRTLAARGVPRHVIDAVISVTRLPSDEYFDMVRRAVKNPLGRVVKLADNTLNLLNNDGLAARDPARAASLKEKRYLPARVLLLDGIDETSEDIDTIVVSLTAHLAASTA